MARVVGKAGSVVVATVTTAAVRSWSIDYNFDTPETTGMDSAGHRTFLAGIDTWSGSFSVYKDGAPLTIGSVVAVVLNESTTATQAFTGNIIVKSLKGGTQVDGLATYDYDFQGTAALVIPTA